jgi:hypothetical protein
MNWHQISSSLRFDVDQTGRRGYTLWCVWRESLRRHVKWWRSFSVERRYWLQLWEDMLVPDYMSLCRSTILSTPFPSPGFHKSISSPQYYDGLSWLDIRVVKIPKRVYNNHDVYTFYPWNTKHPIRKRSLETQPRCTSLQLRTVQICGALPLIGGASSICASCRCTDLNFSYSHFDDAQGKWSWHPWTFIFEATQCDKSCAILPFSADLNNKLEIWALTLPFLFIAGYSLHGGNHDQMEVPPSRIILLRHSNPSRYYSPDILDNQ